jgi:hypothetical protein
LRGQPRLEPRSLGALSGCLHTVGKLTEARAPVNHGPSVRGDGALPATALRAARPP